MLKNKRILVNGNSYSHGEASWPYCLQRRHNFSITNLSMPNAGNKYIHDSTIQELAERTYDLVLVVWSGLKWFDHQVENINKFSHIEYTSNNLVSICDWESKTDNDIPFINRNWVFVGTGNDSALSQMEFGKTALEHNGQQQWTMQSLTYMITLQSFLKSQNIPYAFSYFYNYVDELKTCNLYKFLDQTKIYSDQFLYNYAKDRNKLDDTKHPTPEMYGEWAELFFNFIKQNELT